MNEYDGHWITTFTGKKFHYLNPLPEEIDIRDIAHALALTCRFGGHVRTFYSVAEHSIRVSDIVADEYKLVALLHDAHEAYLHDVPRPIKQDMIEYRSMADKIQWSIWDRYNITITNLSPIKLADDILLATEARDLMPNTNDWLELPPPLIKIIEPLTWQEAEADFLYLLNKCLTIKAK